MTGKSLFHERTHVMRIEVIVLASVGFCSNCIAQLEFIQESHWRQAVDFSFATEDFESFQPGSSIGSLPSIGVDIDPLVNGLAPTVLHGPSVGGLFRTGENTLLNGPTEAMRGGDIIVRPSLQPLRAIGYWNTGLDDRTRLTLFRSDGSIIASQESPDVPGNFSFVGIVSSEPFAWARISPVDGNGWFSIDDLQVSSIPAPGSSLLMLGLIGGALRRQRRHG